MRQLHITIISILLMTCSLYAVEHHVSPSGLDSNKGSQSEPFKSISAAAQVAQPGDTITVHEGVYRERVNPPRGGESDTKRIIYQAAPGEKVVIKGSETVKGWKKLKNDTWQRTLPNEFFGSHNPYEIKIHGDWFRPLGGKNRVYHTGAVYLNGHWLTEAESKEQVLQPVGEGPLWFGEVDDENTEIYAQFDGVDPNAQTVEINVRESVFYPKKTGINFITVRGFTMEQAAPNWAPPTAEQVGLIGTHWSKGWIIEHNTIRYATCTGITLGKYGDAMDNRAQSATGYVGTINRALKNGWSKDLIGHHVVRDNHISHCEQAGIVGSMGASFSTVTGNTIHDINYRGLLGGAEMAGIKFHGAIDTVISANHIYRCIGHRKGGYGGIWLDWMTQGTRVTGNLLHNNSKDLFVEVNHGPFLVDNNLFLSPGGLMEASGGGAYVQNLFGGKVNIQVEETRDTPFHKPHSTEILGLSKVVGDDERFYNNLFVGAAGLSVYDAWNPVNFKAAGNVYLTGAKPSTKDRDALVAADFDPCIELQEKPDGWWLKMAVDPAWTSKQKRTVVTTEVLGKAKIPDAPFEQADGSLYRLDADYLGNKRNTDNPAPGPFRAQKGKEINLKVWPKK